MLGYEYRDFEKEPPAPKKQPVKTGEVKVEPGKALVQIVCGDCGAVVEQDIEDRSRLDLALRSFGRAVHRWAFCECGRSR